MSKPLDDLTRYPSLWLGVYACGSLMCVVSLAQLFGGIAAGSATGFFVLAGTFGYEMLSRRTIENKISSKVETLGKQQDRITREIARTRSDVEALKDDMVQTALTLQKEIRKFNVLNEPVAAPHKPVAASAPAAAPASAVEAVKRSFEKMGNRMRPSSFMPKQKPANAEANSDLELRAEKTKKYKDILMSSPNTEGRHAEAYEEPIPDYSDAVLSELIHHAVQNDRIEIFAQPIVKLPSRKIAYLELFARIRARAGIYLPADTYRPLAEKEESIENVDHQLVSHVIDTIRADARRGIKIGYFVNVALRSFRNKIFMADLLEFLRSRRDLAEHLIFELQHDDFKTANPQLIRIIDGLSQLGCRFSLDNITSLDFDDDKLAEYGINYIKLRSALLTSLCTSASGEMELARLKSRLDSSGLKLIVEKFETEHDLLDLLDFEIDYGEGYLFGKPDLEMAYRKQVA